MHAFTDPGGKCMRPISSSIFCRPTVPNSTLSNACGSLHAESAFTMSTSLNSNTSSKLWSFSSSFGAGPTTPCVNYAQLLKTLCLDTELLTQDTSTVCAMKAMIASVLLLAAVFTTPAAGQLAAPNAAGVSLGHINL